MTFTKLLVYVHSLVLFVVLMQTERPTTVIHSFLIEFKI